jgi:hypothetical protein
MSEPENTDVFAWKPVDKKEYWLSLEGVEYGSTWYTAEVKWDGCIHFYHYFNEPFVRGERRNDNDPEDYIHICDIDGLIEKLQLLKAAAVSHFGKDWSK